MQISLKRRCQSLIGRIGVVVLAGVALGGLAAPVAAQQMSGVYVGVAAGGNFMSNTQNYRSPVGTYGNNNGQPIGAGFSASFNNGPAVIGNFGYAFGNGLRAEVEGNYRNNGVSRATFFSSGNYQNGFSTNTGNARIAGIMANFLYDFDMNYFGMANSWIQPYLGIGLGYANVQYSKVNAMLGNSSLQVSMNGTGGAFAYQAIVGAAFPLNFAPGLAVTAEYRYFATTSPSFNGSVQTVPQVNQNQQGNQQQQQPYTLSTFRAHPDVGNSTVLLGLRYSLDPPSSAPTAGNLPVGWSAPLAPVQARTYMVYFANNSAALDGAARQTIADAVQGARAAQASSLQLIGRADRTGNPALNQRLSTQRSDNVANELTRLGVPRGAISVSAVGAAGEPPGVDAQARRVDIVLR